MKAEGGALRTMIGTMLGTRLGRVFASALSSAGARALSIVLSLATVPLALNYLGQAGYGVWATVTSFLAMAGFADLGLGAGMMQAVSNAVGRDDRSAVRRAVTNTFFMLTVVGATMIAVFLVAYPFVPWARAIGVEDPVLAQVAGPAMLAFAVLFAIRIPASALGRLQFALQQGYLVGFLTATASVLTLLGVMFVARAELGLVGMVTATMGAPIIASVAVAAWMGWREPDLLPRRGDLSWTDIRGLANTGSKFLLLELSVALCFASDNLIIAQAVGVESVATYTVYQKIFSVPEIAASFALTPLWTAYGEAVGRGDVAWVRRTFVRSCLLLVGIGLLGGAAVWAASGWLIDLWIGPHFEKAPWLGAALALWVAVDLAGKGVAMFLNGVNVIKQQVYIAFVFVPLCVGLKILFADRYGAAGVPLATAIAYALTHFPAYAWIVRDWFRRNRLAPSALQES